MWNCNFAILPVIVHKIKNTLCSSKKTNKMRPVHFLEGLTSDLFIKTKKYTNLKSKKNKVTKKISTGLEDWVTVHINKQYKDQEYYCIKYGEKDNKTNKKNILRP